MQVNKTVSSFMSKFDYFSFFSLLACNAVTRNDVENVGSSLTSGLYIFWGNLLILRIFFRLHCPVILTVRWFRWVMKRRSGEIVRVRSTPRAGACSRDCEVFCLL